jgi:hypothetical protein
MKTTRVSRAAIHGNWDYHGDKFHNVGVLWDLFWKEVIVYRNNFGKLKLHLYWVFIPSLCSTSRVLNYGKLWWGSCSKVGGSTYKLSCLDHLGSRKKN